MKPVPVEDWDPTLRHIIDDMHGRPLNIHSLMANHPPLLLAWWNLRNYLVNGGDLEQRHCELVILRVAVHMQSGYEWYSHVVRGLDSGLSLEEINGIRLGGVAWNDADGAVLAAVDDVVRDNVISDASRARLAACCTDRQVMDIMLLHGMYRTIACMINTWGIDLDDHVRDRLPGGTTVQSFSFGLHPRGPDGA